MKRRNDGPKDWRPRETRARRDLERLRAALPWPMTFAGDGLTIRFGPEEPWVPAREVHLVKFSETEHDPVVLMTDWTIVLGERLKKALAGEMAGYEHLKGAWAPTRVPGRP